MVQKSINCLIIQNKKEEFYGKLVHTDNEQISNVLKNSMLGDYLCKKFNEEHGGILKSSVKTIPELIHESVAKFIGPKEFKVYCITDDD